MYKNIRIEEIELCNGKVHGGDRYETRITYEVNNKTKERTCDLDLSCRVKLEKGKLVPLDGDKFWLIRVISDKAELVKKLTDLINNQ